MSHLIDQENQIITSETQQSFYGEAKEETKLKNSKNIPLCQKLKSNLISMCHCQGFGLGFYIIILIFQSFIYNTLTKCQKQNQKKKFIVPSQDKNSLGKKTLVLDLDETLVHSSHQNNNSDFSLSMKIDSQQSDIYVNKRPFVEEFILMMSEIYEIIVFTASLQEYAQPTIEAIDKYNKIKYKLFRENCTLWNGTLVKDLASLNRNIKDIILIDNSSISAKFQPENSILINSFFGDSNDKELEKYIPFLIFLSKMTDIRPIQQYEKRFYLKKPFEITNIETKEKQKIEPNQYFEEWQQKKLKTQLRHEIDCYAETPITQETEILLTKEPYNNQKISLPSNSSQKYLINETEKTKNGENLEDEISNEFPQKRDLSIFKNLKIQSIRSQLSNLNINSPLAFKQDNETNANLFQQQL